MSTMSNRNFPLLADGGPDDLPRTLRREREARERAARDAKERETREREFSASSAPSLFASQDRTYAPAPVLADAPPATVERFDVPFLHLVTFLLKAVVAGIPALLLLAAILWFAGQALQTLFPELVKMQILIRFPHN